MESRLIHAGAIICLLYGAVSAESPPNPYCVTGGNWSAKGIMKTLGMPGGVDDMNGCLVYNWGTLTDQTRLALTNPSWRATTFGRKPPWHSYDVEKDALIDADQTREWIRKHPGWFYIIGNEPDNPQLDAGDGMTTEQYARMYHLYYKLIKETDPTATVIIAAQYAASFENEVKADIKWWNEVLAHYERLFDEPMPVEVWNCHCYTPPGQADGERIVKEFFIPYRAYVDTVAGGRYKDVPLWCTEFGIAVWAGLAVPEYMAEFVEQLCPRLEREYVLPTGEKKLVCDRFFWFLGPWSGEWSDSALLAKDKQTATIVGKTYGRLANGYPNPLPAPPRAPRDALTAMRFTFENTAAPWRPMGGDWSLEEGTYRQTRFEKGWGTRSHLPLRFADFGLESDVRINEAAKPESWIGIHFRHSTFWEGGIGGYLAFLRQNGEVGLSAAGRTEPLATQPGVVADTSVFHRLGVRAAGRHIEVAIDGKTVVTHELTELTYPAGLISLETGQADGSFDNVVVEPARPSSAPEETTSKPGE